MRKLVVFALLALALVSCGESAQSTTSSTTAATTQPTAQATTAPTAKPTAAPTQQLAPIPSASELSQLIDQRDGTVTDVTSSKMADGTTGVAVDIQVNSPTQTRVKHIAYGLAQFFFGERSDVGLINLAFHADGYTGMDDPIANFAGVASEYKLGYDESQLWDVMGVFDADLPA